MQDKAYQRQILFIIGGLVLFNMYQIFGILFLQPENGSGSIGSAVQGENIDRPDIPLQINVLNGCGVNGVGKEMTDFCRTLGYDVVEMGNYKNFAMERSMVIDRKGNSTPVVALAKKIGITQDNVVQQFSSEHLVGASIVIGKDYKNLLPWRK